MKLEIDLKSNTNNFIDSWSDLYYYNLEDLYSVNIHKSLDSYDGFMNMFRWKNGIRKISKRKVETIESFWKKKGVLLDLRDSFDWELFETEFNPSQSSAIWKIFLLHLLNPIDYPVFDMHVYRFHHFITNGEIREIRENQAFKYNYYKHTYLPWFIELRDSKKLNPKKMDECFFKFGQILKPLKGVPLKLVLS